MVEEPRERHSRMRDKRPRLEWMGSMVLVACAADCIPLLIILAPTECYIRVQLFAFESFSRKDAPFSAGQAMKDRNWLQPIPRRVPRPTFGLIGGCVVRGRFVKVGRRTCKTDRQRRPMVAGVAGSGLGLSPTNIALPLAIVFGMFPL
jgi:hypothetical protein